MTEPPPFRADLHCHSTCSDGSLTPQQLIHKAKAIGLQALSITDHDTMEAYLTAPQAAADVGLTLITGAEFSTVHRGHSVHLLAYAYRQGESTIQALCRRHRERRDARNKAIIDQLRAHGIQITVADVVGEAAPGTMLGRPHIALAMIRKGYVGSVREAFQRYIGDQAPYYVQGDPISTEETIATLHQANAYAVLAHPHLLPDGNLVHELLELPFDGIEVYYGTFTTEQEARWLKIAQQRGLLATGGSDFHGAIKPHIPLGCSWAPEETFQVVWKRFCDNNYALP